MRVLAQACGTRWIMHDDIGRLWPASRAAEKHQVDGGWFDVVSDEQRALRAHHTDNYVCIVR